MGKFRPNPFQRLANILHAVCKIIISKARGEKGVHWTFSLGPATSANVASFTRLKRTNLPSDGKGKLEWLLSYSQMECAQ